MTDTETTKKVRFLFVGKHTWGSGETYVEAQRNHRQAGGDRWNIVFMWPGPEYPDRAGVYGLGTIEWHGTKQHPVLIQDNRRVPDKRENPLVIGDPA
jgi:hypothetical protein